MKNKDTMEKNDFVHLKKDEDQYSKAIIEMLRSSDSIIIVSETPMEIVVRAKKSYETFDKIEPHISLIRFGKRRAIRDLLKNMVKKIHQNKTDSNTTIINLSGFIFDER